MNLLPESSEYSVIPEGATMTAAQKPPGTISPSVKGRLFISGLGAYYRNTLVTFSVYAKHKCHFGLASFLDFNLGFQMSS